MDLFEKKKIKKLKKKIKRIKEERKRVIINSVRHEIVKVFREAQLVVENIDIVVGKHDYCYGEDTPIMVEYEIYEIKCTDLELTIVCIDDYEPLMILDGYADIPTSWWEVPITQTLDRISDECSRDNSYTYSFRVKDKIYKFIAINTSTYLNNNCEIPGKHYNTICNICRDLYTYSHNHSNCKYKITLAEVESREEYQNEMQSVAEKIHDLYYFTKYDYKNYPIYEYRCRALIVLLSQRYKSGTFSNVPKDIAILIAKKVYDFRWEIII